MPSLKSKFHANLSYGMKLGMVAELFNEEGIGGRVRPSHVEDTGGSFEIKFNPAGG